MGITWPRLRDLYLLEEEVRRRDMADLGKVVNWSMNDPKQINKLARPRERRPSHRGGPLAIPKRGLNGG